MKLANLLTIVVALALSSPVYSADNKGAGRGKDQRGQLTARDYKFVTEATQGALMEIHLGDTARKNGLSQVVKDFGERMFTDHSRANEQLKAVVQSKGATLPLDVNDKTNEAMKDLHNKTGADFDKAYAKHMVKDHEKDVKLYQKASENLDDPQLKSFAAKQVPILQQHLRLARQLNDQINK